LINKENSILLKYLYKQTYNCYKQVLINDRSQIRIRIQGENSDSDSDQAKKTRIRLDSDAQHWSMQMFLSHSSEDWIKAAKRGRSQEENIGKIYHAEKTLQLFDVLGGGASIDCGSVSG
jgi:hypothetical protein